MLISFSRVRVAPVLMTACCLGLMVTSSTQAGPPEALAAIVVHPTKPDVLVLRYENVLGGVLLTDNGGKTVRILPGTAFTRSGLRGDAPPLALVADDTLLMGDSEGLFKADAQGCNASALISNAQAKAIALHPQDPLIAFFVTADGPSGLRTGLWRRAQNGAVGALGADDSLPSGPGFSPTGLLVVPLASAAEQLRFVETGMRPLTDVVQPGMDAGVSLTDAGTSVDGGISVDAGEVERFATAVLRFSDDLGQTWTERELPRSYGPGTARLLAVDPGDPNRVLVALSLDGRPNPTDTVLLSTDAGLTFTPYITGITRVGQAAMAADGRFWLADMGDTSEVTPSGGLWFARRLGEAPERVLSGEGITCLAHDAARNKLWLCRDYELDSLDLTTNSSCRSFAMNDVAGLVSCANQELRSNQNVVEQLCSGYCGALHFADAPLCQVFTGTNTLCGPDALNYDTNIGWKSIVPASALCSGPVDGGVAAVDARLDAGALGDGGANGPRIVGDGDDGCSAAPGRAPRSSTMLTFGLLTLLGALVRRRRAQRL